MRLMDTTDKIVSVYLAGVCRQEFEFKGAFFVPKPVYVSPLIFRGYVCHEGCGACCASFSLDYLPEEAKLGLEKRRYLSIGGKAVEVYSDQVETDGSRWCKHLDLGSGRCSVYDLRPFACDFELIRFIHERDRVILTQKLYGRAWAMTRLDGELGARCEMLETDPNSVSEVRRKLTRLSAWAHHLGVVTCLEAILEWVDSGPVFSPLRLSV